MFFHAGSLPEKKGFFALELTPAGACRAARRDPTCRMPDFRRRSGCVPAEALSSAQAMPRLCHHEPRAIVSEHYSGFVRTRPSGFVRTTTTSQRGLALHSAPEKFYPIPSMLTTMHAIDLNMTTEFVVEEQKAVML